MMREINAVAPSTNAALVSEADLEEEEEVEGQQQQALDDEKDLQEIDALLASPSGAGSPQLFAPGSSAMTDLTKTFEALAVAQPKEEEASSFQSVTVKPEPIDQDPELGFATPYKGNAVKTLAAAIIAQKRAEDALTVSASEHTEESSGSVIAYEQVKVGKKDKEALGTERAMTPVRRSARTGSGLDERKSFKVIFLLSFPIAL